MFATLVAFNTTDPDAADFPDSTNTGSNMDNSGGGPNTSLAMYVLRATRLLRVR